MVSTRFIENDKTISRARDLRRNSTTAEVKLWSILRGSQLTGVKFRRQQRLGPYIADFVCQSARLVVEIDGDLHTSGEAIAHDGARTAFLESEGYRVIRFGNGDVMLDIEGVADTIPAALTPSSSHAALRRGPLPLPHGERAI